MRTKFLLFLITILFNINLFAQSSNSSKDEKLKLYPKKDIVSRYHNDWTQNHYKERIEVFENNPLQFHNIVFIGNSITEKGGDWSSKFGVSCVRNRGIAGDVTDGVIKRLNEIVFYEPKAVFILIGINDLFNKHNKEGDGRFKYDKIVPTVDYIADNILKIAKIIRCKSSETKVYIQTVLPTRVSYLKEDILLLNNEIKSNETLGYYKVIDLFNEFVDAKGEIIEDLTVDGVHLSDKGYEKWVMFEKEILLDCK